MSPFLYFPPSDEKEGRNHARPFKKKAAARSGFLMKFEEDYRG